MLTINGGRSRPRIPATTSSLVREGIGRLGGVVHGGLRSLAADIERFMNATQALAPGREGAPQSDIHKPAHTADLVDARRKRRRISLADLIFKALCLMIAGFFFLVLGVFGIFLYLIG